MRPYIRDHAAGQPWATVLTALFPSGNPPYCPQRDPFAASAVCSATQESDLFKSESTVLFLHADATFLEPWIDAVKDWFLGHLVIVTSPGGRTMRDLNLAADFPAAEQARLHPCAWSLDHFRLFPPPPRLERWLQQVETKAPSEVDWSLLRPLPPEALYAVKILCEACELTSDPEYSSRISAPTDWMAPFGNDLDAAFKDIPDDPRTQITDFLRKSVKSAIEIGEAKTLAETTIQTLNN